MADKKVDNVFAVEKLIKTKQEKGKTFYLVKWKGWSARHNTWEPEENILDEALLADYNERQAKIAQKKAEKSEKTANKKRGSGGSTGKKEKVTPEQPPSKRPRRLAGGDIREESSDSSEHDEQEEAPSTSTAPPAEEDKNGTGEPAAAVEHPEESAEDEPQEQDLQDEQERVVELSDEETENDTENELTGFVEVQPDYEDVYGEEAPEMVDYEHDEEGIELPEEGYIVGHTRKMERGATQMAFIVGFPSAESSQSQMQVVESPEPIKLEEEERQRIQEIKNELQEETFSMLATEADYSESASSSSDSSFNTTPSNLNILEVEYNNSTVQLAEF